jgi:large repetitive protein
VIALIELNALKDAKGKKGDVKLVSGNAVTGDAVLFTNSSSTVEGNLSVTTGSGADKVGIGHGGAIDVALADFLADQGWDPAEVEPGAVAVLGKLTVKTGGGNDEAMVGGVTINGGLSVDMGSGTDECLIENSTAGSASVKMGAGNEDYLGVKNNVVTGKVTVDGGAGANDVLEDLGGNSLPNLGLPRGFEIIL